MYHVIKHVQKKSLFDDSRKTLQASNHHKNNYNKYTLKFFKRTRYNVCKFIIAIRELAAVFLPEIRSKTKALVDKILYKIPKRNVKYLKTIIFLKFRTKLEIKNWVFHPLIDCKFHDKIEIFII